MLVARRGILALLVIVSAGLAACDSTPSASVTNIGVSGADGRAPDRVVPNLTCAGLDECTCARTPGCAPLTTDCYCPPASCGGAAACSCEGGRYLGCNPVGNGCSTSSCGLLAQPSAPDGNGCTHCAEPTDCTGAITQLAATCASLPVDSTQWLCGGTDSDSCAALCLAGLRTCESATCALCLDCSCGTDLFDSCMSECLSSAQNRH
jgi:hypothetical protein